MAEDSKKTNIIDSMLAYAAKDWMFIIIAILVLGACLYTLRSVGTYQDRINQVWIEQWQESGCAASYSVPNITFNYGGEYDATKDRNQDTNRSGFGYS